MVGLLVSRRTVRRHTSVFLWACQMSYSRPAGAALSRRRGRLSRSRQRATAGFIRQRLLYRAMCGRYSLFAPRENIETRFDAEFSFEYEPRYNAAPSQDLPVITSESPGAIQRMEWGLIPSWADNRTDHGHINARAETLAEKRSFAEAYESRRCLVPADGFYEWVETSEGKQPYRVALPEDELFAMAGLYERWEPPQRQTGLGEFGASGGRFGRRRRHRRVVHHRDDRAQRRRRGPPSPDGRHPRPVGGVDVAAGQHRRRIGTAGPLRRVDADLSGLVGGQQPRQRLAGANRTGRIATTGCGVTRLARAVA